MNSLEVQEVQKEVSLLKSAVKVLHDEARALKKKLKGQITKQSNKQSSETYSTTPEEEILNDTPSSGMRKVLINILLWRLIRS